MSEALSIQIEAQAPLITKIDEVLQKLSSGIWETIYYVCPRYGCAHNGDAWTAKGDQKIEPTIAYVYCPPCESLEERSLAEERKKKMSETRQVLNGDALESLSEED